MGAEGDVADVRLALTLALTLSVALDLSEQFPTFFDSHSFLCLRVQYPSLRPPLRVAEPVRGTEELQVLSPVPLFQRHYAVLRSSGDGVRARLDREGEQVV